MTELKNFPYLFRLDGKVAVITGGSRGIGLHTASAFLNAGAKKVILVARKAEGKAGLNQAMEKLNALKTKGIATGYAVDLSQLLEIERLVQLLRGEERVDIVVANAGATWGGPFEPTPDWATSKILDLNVRSIFNLIRLTAPILEKAGTPESPSRVVIVGAIAGFTVPLVGDNGTIMYSVSKAAAHHLAANLAVELGPRNICVNAVAPGFFPSKLANGLIGILGGTENMAAANPRRRIGHPEDIAGIMVYLCSPAGAYVNGATIPVDGGNNLQAGLFTKL
ncbi:hypothetical protein N7451_003102 [Penicillium sp. IBT 35674x]|nr:hypothetical protein N7451_003102 [Penicillium sp. IBT 35674x]